MLGQTLSRHPWKVLCLLAASAAAGGWLSFGRLDAAMLCAAATALIASRAPDMQRRARRPRWDDKVGVPLYYPPEGRVVVRQAPLTRHPRPNG